jgi:sirohydrochlorin ferrochelatase
MSRPALLAVAHGSRDPAARAAVAALAGQVNRLAPVLDVRLAFVQHATPSLADGLRAAGSKAVVVPLLLSTGYHLTADIAGAARSAGARVARPLGPDELLCTALAARLAEADVPPGTPVVLAAAGSADPQAAADARRQARLLAGQLGAPVVAAFAAARRPTVEAAVARLRARTGGPVAIAAYLLAPGSFHDRLRRAGADWVSAPLGGHPAVAGLVIDRYRVAAQAPAA